MEARPETKMQYFTVHEKQEPCFLKPNNEKPQRDELLRELVKGLQRSLKRQTFVCTCNRTAPLSIHLVATAGFCGVGTGVGTGLGKTGR